MSLCSPHPSSEGLEAMLLGKHYDQENEDRRLWRIFPGHLQWTLPFEFLKRLHSRFKLPLSGGISCWLLFEETWPQLAIPKAGRDLILTVAAFSKPGIKHVLAMVFIIQENCEWRASALKWILPLVSVELDCLHPTLLSATFSLPPSPLPLRHVQRPAISLRAFHLVPSASFFDEERKAWQFSWAVSHMSG